MARKTKTPKRRTIRKTEKAKTKKEVLEARRKRKLSKISAKETRDIKKIQSKEVQPEETSTEETSPDVEAVTVTQTETDYQPEENQPVETTEEQEEIINESLDNQMEFLKLKKKPSKKAGKKKPVHKPFMKKLLGVVKKSAFAPLLIPLIPFIPIMKAALKKKGKIVTGVNPEKYILAFYNTFVKPSNLDDSENFVTALAVPIIKAVAVWIKAIRDKKAKGEKLSKLEEIVDKTGSEVETEIQNEKDIQVKMSVGEIFTNPIVLIAVAVGLVIIIRK
jgi:hypothetical protein